MVVSLSVVVVVAIVVVVGGAVATVVGGKVVVIGRALDGVTVVTATIGRVACAAAVVVVEPSSYVTAYVAPAATAARTKAEPTAIPAFRWLRLP
jgi:hypothetical protein